MNELRTLLNEDSACLIGPLAWEVCIIVVLSIVRASGTRRFLRDFGRGRAGLDSNVNDNTDDAWVNARCERLSIGHASRPRRSAKNNLNALQNSKEISLRVRSRVSFETRKNASPPEGSTATSSFHMDIFANISNVFHVKIRLGISVCVFTLFCLTRSPFVLLSRLVALSVAPAVLLVQKLLHGVLQDCLTISHIPQVTHR